MGCVFWLIDVKRNKQGRVILSVYSDGEAQFSAKRRQTHRQDIIPLATGTETDTGRQKEEMHCGIPVRERGTSFSSSAFFLLPSPLFCLPWHYQRSLGGHLDKGNGHNPDAHTRKAANKRTRRRQGFFFRPKKLCQTRGRPTSLCRQNCNTSRSGTFFSPATWCESLRRVEGELEEFGRGSMEGWREAVGLCFPFLPFSFSFCFEENKTFLF